MKVLIVRPVASNWPISSPYGKARELHDENGKPYIDIHRGTDFAVPEGTPILGVANGFCMKSGWESGVDDNGHPINSKKGFGLYVVQDAVLPTVDEPVIKEIRAVIYYGHQSELKTEERQRISRFQLVGLSGNTGHSTGPHLCLRIRSYAREQFLEPVFEIPGQKNLA